MDASKPNQPCDTSNDAVVPSQPAAFADLSATAYRFRSDNGLVVESISDEVRQLTGFSAEDFTSGRIRWTDIVAPDDVRRYTLAVEGACREGQVFQLEYRIRHDDGSERWVRELGQGVNRDGTVPVVIGGFLTDATPLKQAEQELSVTRQYLRAHIEDSPLAVVELDRESRIVRWSSGAQRLFGWRPEEVLGRGVFELPLVAEGDAESVRELIADLLSGAQRHTRSASRNHCRDGSAVHCAWYNTAIFDTQGRPTSILSQIVDVTDRAQSEDAPHRQVALNQHYLDTVQTLIVALDAEGRITMINRKGCEILGYRREELLGSNWFAICLPQPEGTDRVYPVFCRIMAGELGSVEYFENPVRCSDGRIRLIAWHNALLTDDEGMIIGTLSSGEDITERRHAEEALHESRERLALALEAAGAGRWEFGLQSGHAACDTDCYRLWGVEPGLEGLDEWLEVVHPEDRGWVRKDWLEAAKGGEELHLEFRIKHPQSGVRWLGVVGRTVRDEHRRPVRMIGLSFDITERKQAEEALRESQADLNRAQAVGHIGSWRLDARSGALTWSAENYRILGVREGTPLSYETFLAAVHPDDREYVDRMWQASRRGGAHDIEHRLLVDGEVKWVRERAELEFDQDGNLLVAFGTTQDVTDRKRAEEALREADRRKDEFLAILAHELRNPLAPIRNAVEILKLEGSPDPTLVRARDMIERQLAHLVRLIEDLMDVGRITRGKLQLRRKVVELRTVLEQAAETIEPQLALAGQTFSLSLPTDPVFVDADPMRLTQVLMNLLDNACKYTGNGGDITLAALRHGPDVEIRVQDTGIGIPSEHLSSLFKMFSRVGASSGHTQHGLGIGLALARGLVEMHGGRIEASSEGLGRGSTLIVRLPVLSDPSAPASRSQRSEPAAPAGPLRVLVADDNRDVVDSLAMLLELTGYEVERAYDGLQAVEAAERCRPDLVLLDIGMPNLDGYEVCRRIRQQPWGRDLLVVALTGWGQEDDRLRSKAAGFDNHLVKPVDRSELLRLLAERWGPSSDAGA